MLSTFIFKYQEKQKEFFERILLKFPSLARYGLLFYAPQGSFLRWFNFHGYYILQLFLRLCILRFYLFIFSSPLSFPLYLTVLFFSIALHFHQMWLIFMGENIPPLPSGGNSPIPPSPLENVQRSNNARATFWLTLAGLCVTTALGYYTTFHSPQAEETRAKARVLNIEADEREERLGHQKIINNQRELDQMRENAHKDKMRACQEKYHDDNSFSQYRSSPENFSEEKKSAAYHVASNLEKKAKDFPKNE